MLKKILASPLALTSATKSFFVVTVFTVEIVQHESFCHNCGKKGHYTGVCKSKYKHDNIDISIYPSIVVNGCCMSRESKTNIDDCPSVGQS